MASQRIIKKYPNRRLYDTSLGAYIVLKDVKQLVLDCVDFKIIDARSEKDITQITLLQIISEQESGSTPLFTNAVLQDFIRFYHEKSQHIFSQYLEQAMSLYSQQKKFINHQWSSYQQLFSDPHFMEQAIKMQKMWSPTDLKKKPGKTSASSRKREK